MVLDTIELSAFEKVIANESDEVAAAFDFKGRLVLAPRRGTPVSVHFFPEEREKLRDTIVSHVHPLGGPFSGADVRFAADNDVLEIRAVLSSGLVYSLMRPSQGWPLGTSMQSAAERCLDTIDQEALRRLAKGKPAISEREYERLTFEDQRDAFSKIGVTMEKERWQ